MLFRQTLLAAAVGLMSAAAVAAPVTTQGTGVGKHGDMTVAVTFDNGRIQAIEIVKEAENPVLAKKVYTDLKAAVIASNSADLDAISGATFSSKGFLDAVKDAAKKAGVTLSKADAKAIKKVVKNIPAVSNYDVVVIGDMKVINVMTANALDAAKWCRDYLGVRFEDDNLFFFGGHSRKRALIPVGHTGTEFIAKFQAKADELGIPVITDMKAEELIKDKTGRVVGVKATSHGATYTFNAKGGVVLATGGFGANKAMVKKYNPKIDERFKTTDAPGTTGEALYMAKRAGAQLVNMGYIQTYPICDPISGVIELIADSRFDGAIMLNQEGKRFVEELERRDVLSEAILKQTGNYCWVLWNDNIGKISNTVKEHPTEYEAFTKQGIMATCPDLKCIADFTKMPLKQLESTVKRVSSMAGKGNDKDFHHRGGLMDMSEGQYYVIKAVPSTHHTMGGVRINEKAQALTAKGQVIPGLWAAGEVTGVTHGTNRLGGNAYTDIIVFGRIAGEAAAFEAAARSAK